MRLNVRVSLHSSCYSILAQGESTVKFLLLYIDSFLQKISFCALQDWTDYDEKLAESVGIYEVTHQFKKC